MARCASRPATRTIADRRPVAELRFEADLDLVVDGNEAHVSGDGANLVIETSHPDRLLRALRRSGQLPHRRRLATMADALAARGASVRLQGPHGRLLTVGADADTSVLRLLTGTRHIAPGALRSVLSFASFTPSARWRRIAVTGGLLAIVAATWRMPPRRSSLRKR